jgi:beta-lactamase class A
VYSGDSVRVGPTCSIVGVISLAALLALQASAPAPTAVPMPAPTAASLARLEATPTPAWSALTPPRTRPASPTIEPAPIVALLSPTPVPPGRLSTSLQQLIEGRDSSQNVGVLVEDQATAERYSHESGRTFRSASVYKLPLAYEVLHRVDQRQLALEDVIKVEPDDASEGEPLGGLHMGDDVTIERALEAMISVSSNAAAHALMRVIGRPELNLAWAEMGWLDTHVPETESVSGDNSSDHAAVTSAADMSDLLDRFLRGELLSAESNQLLLRLLSKPAELDPLSDVLPNGTEHFEKTGNVDDASTIASVIYTTSGPLIVVVLDEGMSPPHARALIGDIAATAYDAVNR